MTLPPVHDPRKRQTGPADIMNMAVWELERDTGKVVNKIGRAGHAGVNSRSCM
jgi:hypothetical protein